METIVNRLVKEVNGENRPEKVFVLENLAAENIADVSKEESFYKIPIENIVSIASKTELSEYEDALDIIKRVINGTLKAHPDNQESINLLQAFKLDRLPQLNLAECVDIFQTFTNIDLCVKLGEQFSLPEVDYECLLEQKTNQYEQLKQQNEQLTLHISYQAEIYSDWMRKYNEWRDQFIDVQRDVQRIVERELNRGKENKVSLINMNS